MNKKIKYTFFDKNFFYIFLIIFLGFIIRYYYFIGVDAWFDEWNMLYTVDPNISNEDTWKRYYGDRGDYYILPEHYPPLYAFILKKFLSLFGYSVENARILSLIFGSGSLILVYYLTKLVANFKSALIATSLVTLNLFLIWQTSEIRPHSFVIFFSLLNIIFFFKFINQKKFRYNIISILYIFSSVILLSSWPFTLTIFFGKLIYLFHEFVLNKKKNIYIFITILISLIIYVFLNHDYLLYQLSRDGHYTKLYLSFFYSYHFRSFFGSIILGGVFLLTFGCLLFFNLKNIFLNSKKINLFFIIIISSYFLTIIYSILGSAVISPKYIIFILPLIIIWIVIKIETMNFKFKNYLISLLILSSLLNCYVNFNNIPIDRPPTKKVLNIISNSNIKNILTPNGNVFANFIRINEISIQNNLIIHKMKEKILKKTKLKKKNFWFLCLNNPRFARGDNNLPDHEKCKSLDNKNFLILTEEIRLTDYLLKRYTFK